MSQRIIFHIGASKCGSSALQTELSKGRDLLSPDGRRDAYAVFDSVEGVCFGSELKARLNRYARGYIPSPDLKEIKTFDDEWYAKTRKKLATALADHDGLIFSSEGWFNVGLGFRDIAFFERLGIQVEVIAYIRPQVQFMNSAWWQWGAWTGKSLDEYIEYRLPSIRWDRFIDRWKQVPGVSQVKVKLLGKDVVSDFFEHAGIVFNRDSQDKVNKGLPSEILRLYQRHRDLRASPSASVMDFVLSRHLGLSGETPWVITPQHADHIIRECSESNRKLDRHLDRESLKALQSDPGWWDAGCYRDKAVAPWQPIPATDEKMDRLCAEMARAILRLDKKLRLSC
ncbi:hypothetical protein [Thiobaca trueperi]|uniref:Uncharacterized protein n=1 Tax=Thiobaca trueperi TaxID=127458 RepID=A0A4R3N1F7_9GAMM|nr:hypothetical protein [Thiobaca trueperi]TCT22870.1 hypothetical protein EDC35_102201 [Thiobaca trueperi]